MKDFRFPEQMFKNALSKCESFNFLLSTLKERMKLFDYPRAFKIEYTIKLNVTFKHHHVGWPDEPEKTTKKLCVDSTDTVVGYFGDNDYRRILLKLITQHYKDAFYDDDLCSFHKVDNIEISPDGQYSYINNLIAWSNDTVGIYYVEQECGEHWITLPKEPEQKVSTYLHLGY